MGELLGHAATRQFFTDKKSFAKPEHDCADAYAIVSYGMRPSSSQG